MVVNWVLEDKQELIDIIETIYKGAKKGRGLVVSPKGELTALEMQVQELMDGRLQYQVQVLNDISRYHHRQRRRRRCWEEDVVGAIPLSLLFVQEYGRLQVSLQFGNVTLSWIFTSSS